MTTRAESDGGQATIEFALSIPIVVVMALGILQVALVARDRLALEHAARAGARAASVSPDPAAAADRAARAAVSIEPLAVHAVASDEFVTVTVRYTDPTDLPLIGALIPDVPLSAAVTMHREPP